MNPDSHAEKELEEQNQALEAALRELGKDPRPLQELTPQERNVLLSKALDYARREQEALLLGQEPPPEWDDPLSESFISDIEDCVDMTLAQLLGSDYVMRPAEELTPEEMQSEFDFICHRLELHGITVAFAQELPVEVAYPLLIEILEEEGVCVMPLAHMFIDGCSGACEECVQFPYCEVGQELAEECGESGSQTMPDSWRN